MGACGSTGFTTPTISKGNDTLQFQSSWRNYYDGVEEWDWKLMDYVWFLDGGQFQSIPGGSVGESDTLTLNDRSHWYPNVSWRTLTTVQLWTRGSIPEKQWVSGWACSPVLSIGKPHAPEVSVERNGNDVTVTVKPDVTDYDREVYDTVIRVYSGTCTDPQGGVYGPVRWTGDYISELGVSVSTETVHASVRHVGDSEWTKTIPATDIENALKRGTSRALVVEAHCRGISGDGPKARAMRVFAHPRNPEISSIALNADSLSMSVNSWWDNSHPVDTMAVESMKTEDDLDTVRKRINSPGNGYSWTDSGETFDGHVASIDCLPLAKLVSGMNRGKHLYVRLVTKYDSHQAWSPVYEVSQLYKAEMTVTPGGAIVYGCVSGDDGKSVAADIAWRDATVEEPDKDLKDYKHSTEVSWAGAEYAWQANSNPSTYDMGWETTDAAEKAAGLALALAEARKVDPGAVKFDHCGRIYVSGLTEGEPVFVRARRKWTKDSESGFGEYSNIANATPVSAPAWVELDAPGYIARGESLPLTWTFGSDAEQTGWTISSTTEAANGTWSGNGLASGDDADGHCVIPASQIPAKSTITLRAGVTTGGSWKYSDPVTVRVADAPTVALATPSGGVIHHKALELGVTCTQGSTAAVSIVSRGITYATPQGMRTQHVGDVVWSGSTTGGTLDVTDADLIDGCTYDVIAIARDDTTGLSSKEATGSFLFSILRGSDTDDSVPDESATLPKVTVTANRAERSATLAVSSDNGEVLDVYRVTQDGVYLIARGVESGSTVTDRFAPYGNGTSYRVSSRTGDGDEIWLDVGYSIPKMGLRLDWDGKFVELDYNGTFSDSLEKRFEATELIDGRTVGAWDDGYSRGVRASTELVKLESYEQRRLVREMGRYAGAVFVRTGEGLAFDADVQLGDMSISCNSGSIAVSFDVTEVELTEDHMCSGTDITGPVTP